MTIKELARLAGVSTSTVSKVMNQKDEGISAETRERILSLARKYGYSPYSSISTIPSKTPLIGAVLRSQSQEIAEGIMEQAQALGHRVIYSVSGSSLKTESQDLCGHLRAGSARILRRRPESAAVLRYCRR